MATKHTCSICLNDFTEPKLLPCHHTFCKQCIDDCIKLRSRNKNFNCPICRQVIKVPEGGASQFVSNFYLEVEECDNKQYCTKHKKKEIDVYCRDCRKPCCVVCATVDHENHTKAHVDDVDSEIRVIIQRLKSESEQKLKQLQQHSNFLKTQICDFNTSCKAACDNVDSQVNIICDKARKLGNGIKHSIIGEKIYENSKITQLVEDVDKMASDLKEWCDYSDCILQQRSIITTIDSHGLANIQTKTDYDISTHLQVPVVRHPYYHMVKVDIESLKQQLGNFQTMDGPTFTSSFNVNQIVKPDWNYFSDNVMIQGMPWHVGVKHNKATKSLSVCLWLREFEDKTVKSVTASRMVKLLNVKSVSKCIVASNTESAYIPGGKGWGWDSFIEWGELSNPDSGYIDEYGACTVQTTVKVDKIDQN